VRAPLCLLVLALLGLPAFAQSNPCDIPEDEHSWTQRALDTWERASRELLHTSPTPLPWIVLVGPRCAWHLGDAEDAAFAPQELVDPGWIFAGQPVKVGAVPHQGRVHLPDGSEIPAAKPTAGARLRDEGRETFFTMSTLAVWRASYPDMPESDLQPFFRGVFSHEIVHTRQLVAVGEELGRLVERYGIEPKLDDDVVERTFAKKGRYRKAYERERDLLFQAAAEADDARARSLAAEALRLAERRRSRWMSGRKAWLGEMEALFLAMEGVAEWCRYRLLTDDPAETRDDAELLAFVRGKDNDWSQDEGLALFLLIDRFAPGWQAGALEGLPPSPFELLSEALAP
jgi:hypothetical protein